MSVNWTDEQKRVIDARDHDILCSAAAGSGKTAVLVQRIISLITGSKGHAPIDVDRLLVVTFTNAAAAEMRERIRDSLEEIAAANPDDVHLQRQLVLVHNAKIMTIDGFCLQILRNHFQMVGIDPSFRVADKGELRLLEQDAAEECVNAAYEKMEETGERKAAALDPEDEFSAFLEQFATGKNDAEIETMILDLYHAALGHPFPKDWLSDCRRMYEADVSLADAPWTDFIVQDTKGRLDGAREKLREAKNIAAKEDGPYMYLEALSADEKILDALLSAADEGSYRACHKAFRSLPAFTQLSRKKDSKVSPQKREKVKNLRNELKKEIEDLKKQYYYESLETLSGEYSQSAVTVRSLTRLTEDFMDCLAEKKAERNVLDFSDMEHYALQALVIRETDGEGKEIYRQSAVAREYAASFDEVLCDEYQDTSLVQELILQSVSGVRRHDRFMVGDIKQSIYRFRLARPELFLDKYKTYGKETPESLRIDLSRNFRSRPEVIDSVNDIFSQIMTEELGDVAYDESAALYSGADYPEAKGNEYRTEFLLLDGGNASAEELRALEARMIGLKIKEIVGKLPVVDEKTKELRPARYGDIVILLRTVSGWAETFGEVLSDMGIPCFTGSMEGYFSAKEVRTVLSYLRILDNPLQDIPLAAVLRSPIGDFSDEELAGVRLSGEEGESYYECCRRCMEKGTDTALQEKLSAFFATYEMLRKKSAYTPVHELIWELLDVTGYGEYAEAMPAGKQRRANLDMLVEKAIAYEATSYRGLYHFVRYIENLQKYEVDYGEASLGNEADDTVQLMSIHKSKGLEFPIVILGGLGKQFNKKDVNSRVVIHPDLGIACDALSDAGVPDQPRMKEATLLKKTIRQKIINEDLGEELRVLYVAMTRSKEKLILCGAVKDAAKSTESWQEAAAFEKGPLPYSWLSLATSYLDWVAPAALRKPQHIRLKIKAPEEAAAGEAGDALSIRSDLKSLAGMDLDVSQDSETEAYLDAVFASGYPYESGMMIPGKLSVSELKKMSQQSEETEAEELYPAETVVPLVPRFAADGEEQKPKSKISGAKRGTAWHSFMESLDFSRAADRSDLRLQLEDLVNCGKMSQDEAGSIYLVDIEKFLKSDIGRRMAAADKEGRLLREQPFVLGLFADEIYGKDAQKSETVLIQGIIDACFTEEDGIVLLDYKTDHVSDAQTLIDRYRVQMDYYAKALERLTHQKVKERILYSFTLGEEIPV